MPYLPHARGPDLRRKGLLNAEEISKGWDMEGVRDLRVCNAASERMRLKERKN
jgi:hypothetical protein